MQEYSSKVWGFWGTLLFGVVIFVALSVGQLIPLYIYMLFGEQAITSNSMLRLADSMETDALLLSISAIGSAFFVLPIVFGIAKLKRGSVLKEYFDVRLFSWKTFLIWFVVMLLYMVFETYAMRAMGVDETPSFMLNIEFPSILSIALLLFAVTIVAPLIEESIFRGFLLKGFMNSFLGVYGAIVLTSALWAVIHFQYEFAYVFLIFIAGLIFGYARVKSNSILLPMVMHFFMNLVAALGLFYEKGMI